MKFADISGNFNYCKTFSPFSDYYTKMYNILSKVFVNRFPKHIMERKVFAYFNIRKICKLKLHKNNEKH
jgi:hypothetical protein